MFFANRFGMVARGLVHFGLESAGRNAGHQDIVARQFGGKPPGQLDHPCFGRLIGIGLPRVDAQAVDRGDVDHFGGAIKAGGGLQLRMQRLR